MHEVKQGLSKVTFTYNQHYCDSCKCEIKIGENIDRVWRDCEPVYYLRISKELNGNVGNERLIELCRNCWVQKVLPKLRELQLQGINLDIY